MPASADPFQRVVRAEAWINGQHGTIAVVIHSDQVTIVAGEGLRIEVEIGVWTLLSMHVAVRCALLGRKLSRR